MSPRLPTSPRVTRRDALRLGGAAAACAFVPSVHVRRRPRLRVLGTHVTLQEPLRRRAEADLGIDVVFEADCSAAVLQKASTHPESFDVYEQWSNSIDLLWQSRAIQAIDRDRIEHWDEVNDLCKTGRVAPGADVGAGDAPFRLLNVQPDGTLGEQHTPKLAFLPYVHNVDGYGYDVRACGERVPYETESWSALLDPRHRGRVAIINEPTIGLFDLALAARAAGLVEIADVGAITHSEVDALFDLLIQKKREGHFAGFWSSVPHSVQMMESGRVHLESMFSPAATTLRGRGIDVAYAAPREGYRAWHGVMCLSAAVDERTAEAAYAYMNWWLSGWPGAYVARQGYYNATPERSRPFLSEDEWNYWYEGRPARVALHEPGGAICARPGDVRRGGGYVDRLSHIAVWNTVMDTYEHSTRRWYSLLTS